MINRAPIMMAWAFVVAERLGFQREEALSIGRQCLFSTPYSSEAVRVRCVHRTALILPRPCSHGSLCVHGDERYNERRLARPLPRRQAEGRGGESHRLPAVRRAHGQTVSPFIRPFSPFTSFPHRRRNAHASRCTTIRVPCLRCHPS